MGFLKTPKQYNDIISGVINIVKLVAHREVGLVGVHRLLLGG